MRQVRIGSVRGPVIIDFAEDAGALKLLSEHHDINEPVMVELGDAVRFGGYSMRLAVVQRQAMLGVRGEVEFTDPPESE